MCRGPGLFEIFIWNVRKSVVFVDSIVSGILIEFKMRDDAVRDNRWSRPAACSCFSDASNLFSQEVSSHLFAIVLIGFRYFAQSSSKIQLK